MCAIICELILYVAAGLWSVQGICVLTLTNKLELAGAASPAKLVENPVRPYLTRLRYIKGSFHAAA